MSKIRPLALLLCIISLFGCSSKLTEVSPAPASSIGSVKLAGPQEIRMLDPTTEVVANCGGGSGTVIKHPSMSVLTSHTVEWEVGGQIGVGLKIGSGVIPGGVDLSGVLDTHIATALERGIRYTTAWDLPAEPNTKMEYTLAWSEVWQPGYVEAQLADHSVVQVHVRYLTGIQSEIIGQRAMNCDGTEIVTPHSTQVIVLTDVENSPVPEPTTAPSPSTQPTSTAKVVVVTATSPRSTTQTIQPLPTVQTLPTTIPQAPSKTPWPDLFLTAENPRCEVTGVETKQFQNVNVPTGEVRLAAGTRVVVAGLNVSMVVAVLRGPWIGDVQITNGILCPSFSSDLEQEYKDWMERFHCKGNCPNEIEVP